MISVSERHCYWTIQQSEKVSITVSSCYGTMVEESLANKVR